MFLTVGDAAESVSRRRLEPLPKVRDWRVEKEVFMHSFGREGARWDCGMARESGCEAAGTMGWHCSRTAWPSWTGTG